MEGPQQQKAMAIVPQSTGCEPQISEEGEAICTRKEAESQFPIEDLFPRPPSHKHSKNLPRKHEKNHCCSICGKKFRFSSDLERHSLVHSGDKPFKCHQCRKGFRQHCHLKKHLQTVHNPNKKVLLMKIDDFVNDEQQKRIKKHYINGRKCKVPSPLLMHNRVHRESNPSQKRGCMHKWACNLAQLRNISSALLFELDGKNLTVAPPHQLKLILDIKVEAMHSVSNGIPSNAEEVGAEAQNLDSSSLLVSKTNDTNGSHPFDLATATRRHIIPKKEQLLPPSLDMDCHSAFQIGLTDVPKLKNKVSELDFGTELTPDHCHSMNYSDVSWKRKEKRLSCSICAKTFRFSTDLQRHHLVHSGLKPFICLKCGKKFRQAAHLKTHAKRVHKSVRHAE